MYFALLRKGFGRIVSCPLVSLGEEEELTC
jgi:hypothetical protein